MPTIVKTPFTRLFSIEDRAGPANAPAYQALARAQSPSQDFGDVTPVRIPDPGQYGRFKIIDSIRGERGLPTLTIQARYGFTVSEFLRLARKACPLDIQVHAGECQNPADFNAGWDKILVLEGAVITTWGTDDLGALDQSETAVVNENMPVSALDMYEVKQLLLTELAKTQIVQEIVGVVICDTVQCGACGIPSDGCEKVFAVTLSAGGSPGLPAEVIFSKDSGVTFGETNISTLAASENPTGLACVGINLIVISNLSCSLHYAKSKDILNSVATWTEVATGFVCAAGAPNAIATAGPRNTWIVGAGGHIYFTADPTAGVTVQNAGVATIQALQAVHAYDDLNVVAVGASNAVVFTKDGGATWASVTGPLPAVLLNTVWMRSPLEWFIGSDTGRLFYTSDGGVSWVEKLFPGSGTGKVRDIKFPTPTVGYLAHQTTAPAGRILRTIDGGFSWYVLPEGTTTMPANDFVRSIGACSENPNIVYGGGLGDNATDGFLVRGA